MKFDLQNCNSMRKIVAVILTNHKSLLMKKTFLLFILLAPQLIWAQEQDTSYWRRSFKGSVTFNQSSFSENWTGGGTNSISFNTLLNFKANYLRGKHSWENEVDLLYGSMNNAGTGYRKNNDRIFLDTKYGYKLSGKWNMFGALNILTQFANGFNFTTDSLDRVVANQVSQFLSPGFFTAAYGLEYVPKPYFQLRFAPIAPRLTVVTNKDLYVNIPNNYGVPIGQTTRWEWFAFKFTADFDKYLSENVNLKFRYMLFANYETLALDKIDHRLDAIIRAQIAKYFEVQFSGILLYDYDQDESIQLSQALGIGLVYSVKNFKDK